MKAQKLCRKYEISDVTFYKHKAKFGGMNSPANPVDDSGSLNYGQKVYF